MKTLFFLTVHGQEERLSTRHPSVNNHEEVGALFMRCASSTILRVESNRQPTGSPGIRVRDPKFWITGNLLRKSLFIVTVPKCHFL